MCNCFHVVIFTDLFYQMDFGTDSIDLPDIDDLNFWTTFMYHIITAICWLFNHSFVLWLFLPQSILLYNIHVLYNKECFQLPDIDDLHMNNIHVSLNHCCIYCLLNLVSVCVHNRLLHCMIYACKKRGGARLFSAHAQILSFSATPRCASRSIKEWM